MLPTEITICNHRLSRRKTWAGAYPSIVSHFISESLEISTLALFYTQWPSLWCTFNIYEFSCMCAAKGDSWRRDLNTSRVSGPSFTRWARTLD